MKKFATSFALSVALIALLPACGGKSTKQTKECKPCSAKTEEVKKEAPKKVVEYGKEDFLI